MISFFVSLNPIMQAFIAGLFTWICTVFGSSFVFFFREVNEKFLATMQGFAAGVMTAASFWSLLAPAIDYAGQSNSVLPDWFPAAVGFMAGGIFLRILDVIVPHIHMSEDHGDTTSRKLPRNLMLFLAVTIHNIPEGLAIGVAFAGAAITPDAASLSGAVALAIGIGLQNVPEGSALSLPIFAESGNRRKAFNMGQSSALVEPVSALVGAAAVLVVSQILPYALAFAAGAMMFVVVEELIPESQSGDNTDVGTMAFLVGFTIMMILDVALG